MTNSTTTPIPNAVIEKVRAAQFQVQEAVDCFRAAEAEGLHERMADEDNADPGSLAGLMKRRIFYALPCLEEALTALTDAIAATQPNESPEDKAFADHIEDTSYGFADPDFDVGAANDDYMPKMHEARRFIKSNPQTTRQILDEVSATQPTELGKSGEDEKLIADLEREADGLETCSIELGKKPITNPVTLLRIAAKRIQAAPPEPRNGWQWVPKEPTQKMVTCGKITSDFGDGSFRSPQEIYKAMLAAAPKEPI